MAFIANTAIAYASDVHPFVPGYTRNLAAKEWPQFAFEEKQPKGIIIPNIATRAGVARDQVTIQANIYGAADGFAYQFSPSSIKDMMMESTYSYHGAYIIEDYVIGDHLFTGLDNNDAAVEMSKPRSPYPNQYHTIGNDTKIKEKGLFLVIPLANGGFKFHLLVSLACGNPCTDKVATPSQTVNVESEKPTSPGVPGPTGPTGATGATGPAGRDGISVGCGSTCVTGIQSSSAYVGPGCGCAPPVFATVGGFGGYWFPVGGLWQFGMWGGGPINFGQTPIVYQGQKPPTIINNTYIHTTIINNFGPTGPTGPSGPNVGPTVGGPNVGGTVGGPTGSTGGPMTDNTVGGGGIPQGPGGPNVNKLNSGSTAAGSFTTLESAPSYESSGVPSGAFGSLGSLDFQASTNTQSFGSSGSYDGSPSQAPTQAAFATNEPVNSGDGYSYGNGTMQQTPAYVANDSYNTVGNHGYWPANATTLDYYQAGIYSGNGTLGTTYGTQTYNPGPVLQQQSFGVVNSGGGRAYSAAPDRGALGVAPGGGLRAR